MGVAADDTGTGCGHRGGSLLGPHRLREMGSASEAFGSWGVAAADDSHDDLDAGMGAPSPQHAQQPGATPAEEDDLENLMCDEDDFITPPGSPTAASQGECRADCAVWL